MYLKKAKTQKEATARAATLAGKMNARNAGKAVGAPKMVRQEMRVLKVENPKHLGGLKSPIKRKDSVMKMKAYLKNKR